MKCFGSLNSYVSSLCIYGYSFSIYIPIVFACAVGVNVAQWILLSYAAGASTSFILVNYWREMGKYVDKLRYIIIVLIIACQAGLLFVFKLYFFEEFKSNLVENNNINYNNNTNINNNTNGTSNL
jgi:type IV secretory pathway TraG/TraD family ATPase VirD4